MTNPNIVAFSPGQHAGVNPVNGGSHVVASEIQLSKIYFDPTIDELAHFVGPRDADSCPVGTDNLVANANTPPIQGSETRQHLTVPCDRLRYVHGGARDNNAYPVCATKATRAEVDLDGIPAELLASAESQRSLKCPFMYLAGVVSEGDTSIDVAVDAEETSAPTTRHQAI